METISYQINLELLGNKVHKEIKDIQKEIDEVNKKAIIKVQYDGDPKELNRILLNMEKKLELPVDVRLDFLNEALNIDKNKIEKIQEEISNIISDPIGMFKKISEELNELFKKNIADNFDETINKGKELKDIIATFADRPEVFESFTKDEKETFRGILDLYQVLLDQIQNVFGNEAALKLDSDYVGVSLTAKLEEELESAQKKYDEFDEFIQKIFKEANANNKSSFINDDVIKIIQKISDSLDVISEKIDSIPTSMASAFNDSPVESWKKSAIDSIEEVKNYLSNNVVSTLLGWTEGDKLRLKIPEERELNERSFGYTKSGRIVGGYSYDSPKKTKLGRYINKKAEEDNIRLYGYGHSHTNAKVSMFSLPHMENGKINQSDFGGMIDRVENKQHDFSQELLKSFEEVLVFNSRDFYNDFKNYFQDKETKKNTYLALKDAVDQYKIDWSSYYDKYVSKYGSKITVGNREGVISKDRFFNNDETDELAEEFRRQVTNLFKREVYPQILESVFSNGINGKQFKFDDYGHFYSNEEFAQLNPLGEQIDIIGSFIDSLNSLNTIVDRLTSIDLSAFDSLPIIADELSRLNLDTEPHQESDTTTYNDLSGKFGINLFPDKQSIQNDEPYSPTQTFDNEIQQNIVMLENYKNTIAEINRLELEPKTDEIEEKLQELNLLADYFASKITTIRSENGHEINRSMMQFGGTWNNNLSENYTSDQIKGFWDIAGERSGINVDDVESEFYGISEEIKNIEAKSEGLRKALTKDLTESSAYVSRLKADLLGIVETQEDLAAEPKESRFTERMTKDIEVFSKRSPEVLQFVERLKTYEDAVEFVKTDEWLQFLTTLPKAHTYLESIGYDFDKESVNVNNLGKSVTDVTSKINDKTKAFQEEGQIVSEVVEKEVNDISQIGNSLSDVSQKVEELCDEILNAFKNGLTGIKSYPIISGIGIDLADDLVDRFREEIENNSQGIKDSLETLLIKSIQNTNFNNIAYEIFYEIQTKLNDITEQSPLKIFNFDIDAGELSVQIQNELNNKVFSIKLDGAIDNIAQTLNTTASNVENSFIQAIKWIREANEWQKLNDEVTNERFLFANTKTGAVSNPTVFADTDHVNGDLIDEILHANSNANKNFDMHLHWHQDDDYTFPSGPNADLGALFSEAFQDNINKFVIGAQKELIEFDFSKIAQNRDELIASIINDGYDSVEEYVKHIWDLTVALIHEEFEETQEQLYADKKNIDYNYEGILENASTIFTPDSTDLISPLTGEVFNLTEVFGDIFEEAFKETGKFIDPKEIKTFFKNFYNVLYENFEQGFLLNENDRTGFKDIIDHSLSILTDTKGLEPLFPKISEKLLNLFETEMADWRPNEKTQSQLGNKGFKKAVSYDSLLNKIVTFYTNDEFDKKYGNLGQQIRSAGNNATISPVIADDFHDNLQSIIDETNPYYVEIRSGNEMPTDRPNDSDLFDDSDNLFSPDFVEEIDEVEQELKEFGNIPETEPAVISSLIESLDKVKDAIIEKNNLFDEENDIVDRVVTNETGVLKLLQNSIEEIAQAVEKLNSQINASEFSKTIQLALKLKEISSSLSDEGTHYVTDEYGNRKVFYRGLRNSMGQGLVSDRFNGATFWTDNFDLAKEYSQWTKVESAQLEMLRPLEIEGNGANWNSIENLGNYADETSVKIHELREQLNELVKKYSSNDFGFNFDNITSEYGFTELKRQLEELQSSWKDATSLGWNEDILKEINEDIVTLKNVWEAYKQISDDSSNVYGTHNTKEFVELAQKSGQYDGVIFKNIVDSASGVVRDATNVVVQFNEDRIHFLETLSASDNLNQRDITALANNYSSIIEYLENLQKQYNDAERDYRLGLFPQSKFEEIEKNIEDINKEKEQYEKILPILSEYKEKLLAIRKSKVDESSIIVPEEKEKEFKGYIRNDFTKLQLEGDITEEKIKKTFYLYDHQRDLIERIIEVLSDEKTTTQDLIKLSDELYETEYKRSLIHKEIQKQKYGQIQELSQNIYKSYKPNETLDLSVQTESLDKVNQEFREIGDDTETEITTLSALLEPLNKIKESIEEKNKLLTEEGDIAQSSISSEIEWFNKLNEKINEVIRTIGSKISMIRLERAEVEAAVQAELTALNQLVNNPPVDIKLTIDDQKLVQDIKDALSKVDFDIGLVPGVTSAGGSGKGKGRGKQNQSQGGKAPSKGGKKPKPPQGTFDVTEVQRRDKDGNYARSYEYKNKTTSVTQGANGDVLIRRDKISNAATEEEKLQQKKNALYKEEEKLLLANLSLQNQILKAEIDESDELDRIHKGNEERIKQNNERIAQIKTERSLSPELVDNELAIKRDEKVANTRAKYRAERQGQLEGRQTKAEREQNNIRNKIEQDAEKEQQDAEKERIKLITARYEKELKYEKELADLRLKQDENIVQGKRDKELDLEINKKQKDLDEWRNSQTISDDAFKNAILTVPLAEYQKYLQELFKIKKEKIEEAELDRQEQEHIKTANALYDNLFNTIKKIKNLRKLGRNDEANQLTKQVKIGQERLRKCKYFNAKRDDNLGIAYDLLNDPVVGLINKLSEKNKKILNLSNKEKLTDKEKGELEVLIQEYNELQQQIENVGITTKEAAEAYQEFIDKSKLAVKGLEKSNASAAERNAADAVKAKNNELDSYRNNLIKLQDKARDVYENIDKYRESFRNKLEGIANENIDLNNLDEIKSKIKSLSESLDDKSLKANLEGTYTKLLSFYERIQRQLANEPHMNSGIKKQYRELADEIDNLIKTGSVVPGTLDRITKAFIDLSAQEAKTQGFFKDVIDRTREMNVKFLGQFFSFYDIIRYGREIFGIIQELDASLVDLRKTTSMSATELDEFYYSSNEIAKQMGVTTQEIIQQAANWSRLNKIGLLYGNI